VLEDDVDSIERIPTAIKAAGNTIV